MFEINFREVNLLKTRMKAKCLQEIWQSNIWNYRVIKKVKFGITSCEYDYKKTLIFFYSFWALGYIKTYIWQETKLVLITATTQYIYKRKWIQIGIFDPKSMLILNYLFTYLFIQVQISNKGKVSWLKVNLLRTYRKNL